tara:strand:+ start:99 stop:980 length:882 start_codon:yes stop_codon:yes gene_type:complete
MKSLIIGGSGMIGSHLTDACKSDGYETVSTYFEKIPSSEYQFFLDMTDREKTVQLISEQNPDIVFLASALTNVDLCEKNFEMAKSTNVTGTQNVIDGCKKTSSKLVYFSTSAVFDGKKTKYSELDETCPINNYGITKALSEQLIKNSKLPFLIIRTDQPYGWTKKWQRTNSVLRIIDNLKNNNLFNEVTDWYNNPTYIPDMIFSIMELIKQNSSGIYHVVGSDFLSRYDCAILVAEVFNLNKNLLKKINSDELNLPAKRANVNLDTEKLSNKIGIQIPDFKQGLSKMYDEKIC